MKDEDHHIDAQLEMRLLERIWSLFTRSQDPYFANLKPDFQPDSMNLPNISQPHSTYLIPISGLPNCYLGYIPS